jgi:hypothetical protein
LRARRPSRDATNDRHDRCLRLKARDYRARSGNLCFDFNSLAQSLLASASEPADHPPVPAPCASSLIGLPANRAGHQAMVHRPRKGVGCLAVVGNVRFGPLRLGHGWASTRHETFNRRTQQSRCAAYRVPSPMGKSVRWCYYALHFTAIVRSVRVGYLRPIAEFVDGDGLIAPVRSRSSAPSRHGTLT